MASAANKNATLPTFKDKNILIYPYGYGCFPDLHRDCYSFGFKRSQLGTRPTGNRLKIVFLFPFCRGNAVML